MAALTVTAASVVKGTTSAVKTRDGILGATVTAGQPLYLDTADNRLKVCDADSATALARTFWGIALNGGASGQPCVGQFAGPITIGATVAIGVVYVLSTTAGGIAPTTDLATGNYTNVLGVGISATQIDLIEGGKYGGVAFV